MTLLLCGCDAPSLRSGPMSFLANDGDQDVGLDLYRRVTQGDKVALAQLIERALVRKDSYAAFYLGLSFDPNSPSTGIRPDALRAAAYYSAALRLPAAKHNLALLQLSGASAVPADQRLEPIALLEESAVRRVESMLLLAVLFERGYGAIKPNAPLSAQWYSRAIEHSKDRRAQTRLGVAYLEGRGVTQNAVMGQALLLAAAKAGSSEAQYRLALIDQPAIQAAQWLSVAALSDESYHAAAQAALSKVSSIDQVHIKQRARLWVHAHQIYRPVPAFSEPIKSP